jgi:hypothetical protein
MARHRERFMRFVEKREDGCWIWTGYIWSHGYGQFGIGQRHIPAHRFAWQMVNGPIPDDHFICHHCDERRCVNPGHLFVGTHADNMRDMYRKGRGGRKARGEAVAGAVLTADDVRAIRGEIDDAPRGTGRRLAEKYGVTEQTISDIKRRVSWDHVA